MICLRGLTYQEEYVSIKISRSRLCSFKLCGFHAGKKIIFLCVICMESIYRQMYKQDKNKQKPKT